MAVIGGHRDQVHNTRAVARKILQNQGIRDAGLLIACLVAIAHSREEILFGGENSQFDSRALEILRS